MTVYTSDELNAIANAPMTIGMAVAMADMGIISSAIEAVASAAGSGLFGSGDPKISSAEASALAKIKAGLSI